MIYKQVTAILLGLGVAASTAVAADIKYRTDIRALWVGKDKYSSLVKNVVALPNGVRLCRAYNSEGQLTAGRLVVGNGTPMCFIADSNLAGPDSAAVVVNGVTGQRGEVRALNFDFLVYNSIYHMGREDGIYQFRSSIDVFEKNYSSTDNVADQKRVESALPHLLDLGGKDDEITPVCFVNSVGKSTWQPEGQELVPGTGRTVANFKVVFEGGKRKIVRDGDRFIPAQYRTVPAKWNYSTSGGDIYVGALSDDGKCRYVAADGATLKSESFSAVVDSGIDHAEKGFWVPAFGAGAANGSVSVLNLRFEKTIVSGKELKPTFAQFNQLDTLAICRTSSGAVGTMQSLTLGDSDTRMRCAAISENGDVSYDSGNYKLLLSHKAGVVRAPSDAVPANAIFANEKSPICATPYTVGGVSIGVMINTAKGLVCRSLPPRTGVIADSQPTTSFVLVAAQPKSDKEYNQSFTVSDIGAGAPVITAKAKANPNGAKSVSCMGQGAGFNSSASTNGGMATAGTVTNYSPTDAYTASFCNKLGTGANGDAYLDKGSGFGVAGEAGVYVESTVGQTAGGSYGIVNGSVQQNITSRAGAETNYSYDLNWGKGKYGFKSEGGFFAKAGVEFGSQATYGLGNSNLAAKGGLGVGGAGIDGSGTMMLDGGQFTVGIEGEIGIGLVSLSLGINLSIDTDEVADGIQVAGKEALNGVLFVTGLVDNKAVNIAFDVKKGAVQGYSVVSNETYRSAKRFGKGVVWTKDQVVGGVVGATYAVKNGVVSLGKAASKFVSGKVLPVASKIGDGVVNTAYQIESLSKVGAIKVTDGGSKAIDFSKNSGLVVAKSLSTAAYWTKDKANFVADKAEDFAKKGGAATADFFTSTVGGNVKSGVNTVGNGIKNGFKSFISLF